MQSKRPVTTTFALASSHAKQSTDTMIDNLFVEFARDPEVLGYCAHLHSSFADSAIESAPHPDFTSTSIPGPPSVCDEYTASGAKPTATELVPSFSHGPLKFQAHVSSCGQEVVTTKSS